MDLTPWKQPPWKQRQVSPSGDRCFDEWERQQTRLVVIIATLGRKGLLDRLLTHLETQTRPPDEIIVSAPDEDHVNSLPSKRFPVRHVFGKTGLTAQRNAALAVAQDRFEIITFFDDDFLPGRDYLKLLVTAFETHPDWAVVMGNVVRDGVKGAGLTFEQGIAELQAAEAKGSGDTRIVDRTGAYGCNMSIRANVIGKLRFDERLVLYGWQEDIDFTSQLKRHGRVVSLNTLLGVHLGLKSGRVSGLRLGYSQVVNPVYLARKGTVPWGYALELMCRNVAANLVKSIWPEPYIDRRGRLKGNLLATAHVLKGRIEPEHILSI